MKVCLEKIRGRLRAGARGQALVETALTCALFLTLLLGVIEFGYAFYCYDQVSEAAKLGTRYAIVHGSTSSTPADSTAIQNWVLSHIAGVDLSKVQVTTAWSPDNSPGSTVSVTVQYSFDFLERFVPRQNVALAAHSQGVISQ
jgi:Flp pilus assembly protein TadG